MTTVEPQRLFEVELREELEAWLRRRFRALVLIYLVLGGLDLLWTLVTSSALGALALAVDTVGKALGLGVLLYVLRRDWGQASREEVVSAATRLILVLGSISLLASFAVRLIDPAHAPSLIRPIFFWHFSALAFLPWTPRESLRPFVPLMIVWAAMVLVFPGDLVTRVLRIVFGPGVLIPGLAVAATRLHTFSRSFSSRMVGQQFVSMHRELRQARSIHEAMFPDPYEDGHVRFDYTYRPMREIGGDFVHLHVGAEGLVHLTLLDVTGHGLAAALTVNRLYGELERIRAEAPDAEPGEVLELLNRYVHLTMVRHNIYATASCVTADPYLGELRWASRGHPPAYLRGANGIIRDLGATTVLLGALAPAAFAAETRTAELAPRDTVVLFTDGVFETRDRGGRMLGLERVREMLRLQPPPRHWPRFIAAAVERHGTGRPEDDVLIATLTFVTARGQRGRTRATALATADAPGGDAGPGPEAS